MMNSVFKIILATTLAICCLSACSTYVSLEPLANKEWQGKPHSQIVNAYGAPDREVSDGNGGKILVYETVTTEVHTDVNPVGFAGIYGFYYDFYGPASRNVNTRTETKVDYAHFYIGTDGLCYKVSTNLEKEVRK